MVRAVFVVTIDQCGGELSAAECLEERTVEQHSLGCIQNHRGIGNCNGDLNGGGVLVVIGVGWCCESKVMVVMNHSLWFQQRRHDGCDVEMIQY